MAGQPYDVRRGAHKFPCAGSTHCSSRRLDGCNRRHRFRQHQKRVRRDPSTRSGTAGRRYTVPGCLIQRHAHHVQNIGVFRRQEALLILCQILLAKGDPHTGSSGIARRLRAEQLACSTLLAAVLRHNKGRRAVAIHEGKGADPNCSLHTESHLAWQAHDMTTCTRQASSVKRRHFKCTQSFSAAVLRRAQSLPQLLQVSASRAVPETHIVFRCSFSRAVQAKPNVGNVAFHLVLRAGDNRACH